MKRRRRAQSMGSVFVRDALLKCESSGSVNQPPGPWLPCGDDKLGRLKLGSWEAGHRGSRSLLRVHHATASREMLPISRGLGECRRPANASAVLCWTCVRAAQQHNGRRPPRAWPSPAASHAPTHSLTTGQDACEPHLIIAGPLAVLRSRSSSRVAQLRRPSSCTYRTVPSSRPAPQVAHIRYTDTRRSAVRRQNPTRAPGHGVW